MLDLICTIFKCCFALIIVRLFSTAFNWEFGISRQYLCLLEWIFALGEERIRKVESEHQLERKQTEQEVQPQEQKQEQEPPASNTFSLDQCQAAKRPPKGGEKLIDAEKRPKVGQLRGEPTRPSGLELCVEEQTETCTANGPSSELSAKGNGTNSVESLNSNPVELPLQPNGYGNKLVPAFGQQIGGGEQLRVAARRWTSANQPNGKGERIFSNGLDSANWQSAAQLSAARKKSETPNQDHQAKKTRRISTPDGPPVFLLDDYELDWDQKEQPVGREFHLEDALRFVSRGISAIVDDEVTKRFTPEELKSWNLLTRTDAKNYHFMSRSLGLCWLFGLMFRYLILLPMRIVFTVVGFVWLVCTTAVVGLLPRQWRDRPYQLATLMAFRMLSCGITSRLSFHNRQFRAQKGDICVANHTSPIDVVLMACDNCYALVGQRHGGLLGLLESALSRATNHVWFDRGEMRDRQLVTERLKQHVSIKSNLPVLIFPEGTCINNSAVMMFRKGGFETTNRVCPAAIKYDPRFGDPFWNSSKQSYVQYLLMMMSSWAIKCDVRYLPPMDRLPGESAAEFANRVKAEIARQGGLVDLAWDGQLKRSSVKPTWLYQQQEDYVKRLKLE